MLKEQTAGLHRSIKIQIARTSIAIPTSRSGGAWQSWVNEKCLSLQESDVESGTEASKLLKKKKKEIHEMSTLP